MKVQETLGSSNWAIENGNLDYTNELTYEISVKVKDMNKHIRFCGFVVIRVGNDEPVCFSSNSK